MTNVMARRFLPATDTWRSAIENNSQMRYGFITEPNAGNEVYVRNEVRRDGITNELCVFSKPREMGSLVTSALALEEAKELFGICGTRKLKLTRHHIQADELNVLVEEFGDNLSPLTIVQVEMLTRNNTETFPAWIGEEITGQADYNYANLASYGLPGHFYAWSRTRHGLKVAS